MCIHEQAVWGSEIGYSVAGDSYEESTIIVMESWCILVSEVR